MGKKGIDSDLIRGHIDTIILQILQDGDRYGYEIVKDVEVKSQGTYTLKQPTLYSCLKRLESQGKISSYWTDSDIGGKRHYYKLTETGRSELEKNRNDWIQSKSIIDKLIQTYTAPKQTHETIVFPSSEPQLATTEDSVVAEPVSALFEQKPENKQKEEAEIVEANGTEKLSEPAETAEEIEKMIEPSTEVEKTLDFKDSPSISELLDEIEMEAETESDTNESRNDTLDEKQAEEKEAESESKEKLPITTMIIRDDIDEEPSLDFSNISTQKENETETKYKASTFEDDQFFIDLEKQEKIVEKYYKEQFLKEISDYESKQKTLFEDERETEIDQLLSGETKSSRQDQNKEDFQFITEKAESLKELEKAIEKEEIPLASVVISGEILDETIKSTPKNNQTEEDFFNQNEKAASLMNVESELEEFSTFEAEKQKHQPANGNIKLSETAIFRDMEGVKIEKEDSVISVTENVASRTSISATTHILPKPEATKKLFEGKKISGQFTETEYKQVLNELSSLASNSDKFDQPISSVKNEVETEKIRKAEASNSTLDYSVIKKRFEKQGITIRTHKKIEKPKQTKMHLLSNKLRLVRTWLTFTAVLLSLVATYVIMKAEKTLDGTFTGTYAYFMTAVLVLFTWATANTIVYWCDPQKREPSRYAPRASFLIAALFFLQACVITYAINLQIGMTSFTQTNYNHLNWIIPFVLSTAIIFGAIMHYILFKSKKFHS